MYSYPIMPPPKKVEAQLGEQRIIGFSGVGVTVGEEFVASSPAPDATPSEKEAQVLKMCQTA